MNKLNNKGMTLMELIVSVALISIIMIFMYKLISDVRYEKKENDKITDNIIKISEIEVAIENIIDEKSPNKVKLENGKVEFYNNSQKIATLSYNEVGVFEISNILTSEIKKWTLSDIKVNSSCVDYDSDNKILNIKVYLISNENNIYTIEIPYFNKSLTSVSGTSCDSL